MEGLLKILLKFASDRFLHQICMGPKLCIPLYYYILFRPLGTESISPQRPLSVQTPPSRRVEGAAFEEGNEEDEARPSQEQIRTDILPMPIKGRVVVKDTYYVSKTLLLKIRNTTNYLL